MNCAVATTTWNSVDLIGEFLAHYRCLGFDQVLVMDFDSTDGTRDILLAAEWQPFVTMVAFPGLASLDSSNILLSLARERHASDSWCLFCDPDELLAMPSGLRLHPLLQGAADAADGLVIPRFNMTGPLSVAHSGRPRHTHVESLTLRIARRCTRTVPDDIAKEVLEPPWIFTAILPKVLVRVERTIAIGEGDHSASTSRNQLIAAPDGVRLLHYPVREFATFRQKVELARLGFASNPHLSQAHGWQVRRWINKAAAGRLLEEYQQQFIADEDVERLIADGTLCRDESALTIARRASLTDFDV
jgi:hypothetical protein